MTLEMDIQGIDAQKTVTTTLQAFEDPNHFGNSPEYHTGELCMEKFCDKPAGTRWSPYWCFDCNVKRIKRISKQLDGFVDGFQKGGAER